MAKIKSNVRQTSNIDYGMLTGLIGEWQGANGVNLIALPDQNGEFGLLIEPYTEKLSVTAVPATTPNRGLQVIEQMPTLSYHTTINNTSTGSNNALMHVENGFWETVDSAANNGFSIFRLATIPHGNSLVAMGNAEIIDGPPEFDLSASAIPVGSLPVLPGGKPNNGYTDPYISPPLIPDFYPTSPNRYLMTYLQNQQKQGMKVKSTTVIKVSSQNQGGVESIAQLQLNTRVPLFHATFWIEAMVDAKGNPFMQLQYSQTINIEFPINGNMPGQTITWPHINVNTLTRPMMK